MSEYKAKVIEPDQRILAALNVILNVAIEESKKAGREPREFDGMSSRFRSDYGDFTVTFERSDKQDREPKGEVVVDIDDTVYLMARSFAILLDAMREKEEQEMVEISGRDVATYGVAFASGLTAAGVSEAQAYEVADKARDVIIQVLNESGKRIG